MRGPHHRRVNSYFSPFKGETEEEDGFAARGARRLYYFETINKYTLCLLQRRVLHLPRVSQGANGGFVSIRIRFISLTKHMFSCILRAVSTLPPPLAGLTGDREW